VLPHRGGDKILKERPRRLRRDERIRRLVRETELNLEHIICPLFVKEMQKEKVPIISMPDQFQFSVEGLMKEIEELLHLSISSVILFGIPERKDEFGSSAYDENGIVQRALREIRRRFGDSIYVITDVCLCEYTTHGHCGIVKDGQVDNDETLELLARVALSHAQAGSDMVAPSDMMDGRVKTIREVLDRNGFSHIPILSYAAKYASALYGPFRAAAESAPRFGDRRSYQMDPPNSREALKEMRLDIEEGADIIMVKPALFYLDIISLARNLFDLPICAYSVSGEYTMIKLAADYLDYRRTVEEAMISIRRAGADMIITYFAKELARWMHPH